MKIAPVRIFSSKKINFMQARKKDLESSINNDKKVITQGAETIQPVGLAVSNAIKTNKAFDNPDKVLKSFEEEADKSSKQALKEIQTAQKEAAEIIKVFNEEAKDGKLCSSILDLFVKGNKYAPDGTLLREIKRSKKGYQGTLEEYTPDGKLFRRITRDYFFLYIEDGIERLPDGTEKVAEVFDILGSGLQSYKKDYVRCPDGTEKAGQVFVFQDNVNLFSYQKNYVKLSDGTEKSARYFRFQTDKFCTLDDCKTDYVKYSDGTKKAGQYISWYSDGMLYFYKKEYEKTKSYDEKAALEIYYAKGKPVKALIFNAKKSNNILFKFIGNNWKEFKE